MSYNIGDIVEYNYGFNDSETSIGIIINLNKYATSSYIDYCIYNPKDNSIKWYLKDKIVRLIKSTEFMERIEDLKDDIDEYIEEKLYV